MPTYIYTCADGHEFEAKRGYDDATIDCPCGVGIPDFPGEDRPVTLHACGAPATRRAVYAEQGVIFSGVGFTRTIIPPAPPKPNTIAKEPIPDWEDKMHEYAHDQHQDDVQYRDARKQQLAGMKRELDGGKGFKRT